MIRPLNTKYETPNFQPKGWKRIFWIPVQAVFFVILGFFMLFVMGLTFGVAVIKRVVR